MCASASGLWQGSVAFWNWGIAFGATTLWVRKMMSKPSQIIRHSRHRTAPQLIRPEDSGKVRRPIDLSDSRPPNMGETEKCERLIAPVHLRYSLPVVVRVGELLINIYSSANLDVRSQRWSSSGKNNVHICGRIMKSCTISQIGSEIYPDAHQVRQAHSRVGQPMNITG
jgi:hypothetical protein